ncbi:metallophosphoesterase [Shinella curvata]|uniref:Metallophosphoesterase n=1 Tax=Shinella curvata TaxID=1817964 RepID=A0ABT8XMJ7_9HYPH|nr:metallophosphoesterase [Shinella curvata]MCJ8057181.1 metallophosphoesterase [Shinella curvata]MDO6124972.1 metallophosphoesterase [Shinella curvata]
MRVWIISDLHCEFGVPFTQPTPADADVLVCAGDLLTRGIVPSMEWLSRNIASSLPVVLVAGNHEFYGSAVLESLKGARKAAGRYPNIHFLENDAVDISGVRFIGGTLWTDFRVLQGDPQLAMTAAQSGMNDFRKIKLSKMPYSKFKPIHAYRQHMETRAFLASELEMARTRTTVVVTHHAPSRQSLPSEFQSDPLSPCYASDLESLILATQPALWVHGHTHNRNDYLVGASRVVSNPRGYPGEHVDFDPAFTVEI